VFHGGGSDMDPTVTVRRLRESDWEAFKLLRLRGLASDPNAFASTWAEESHLDDLKWIDWVNRGATSTSEAIWVAERTDRSLVGMIGVFSKDHSFYVWGMWVEPTQRGRGIGGGLLDTLLRWVGTTSPSTEVRLSVAPSQVSAVRLYRSRGFVSTGVVEALEHTPGSVCHEMLRRPTSAP